MPTISLLISVFSNRSQQFELSLNSLTKQKFDYQTTELLVFIDYPDYLPILNILKKYQKYFSSIKAFVVTKKVAPINHSASRRNFLATQAKGNYIIFSEPEILHLNNSLKYFYSHINAQSVNQWICGPVYATEDVVNPAGKLIDDFKPLKNFRKILNIANGQNLLKNPDFKKYYHLIDYRLYSTPFYCTMFNRNYFLNLKGLNQKLKVRGFEEIEFYHRFSKSGGQIVIDKNIKTVHLPHPKMLNIESQISWNLYNSTVTFDTSQPIGKITDAEYKTINLP